MLSKRVCSGCYIYVIYVYIISEHAMVVAICVKGYLLLYRQYNRDGMCGCLNCQELMFVKMFRTL